MGKKIILILVQILAIASFVIIILHVFNVITNKYVPVVCYSLLFFTLLTTLNLKKKRKNNIDTLNK